MQSRKNSSENSIKQNKVQSSEAATYRCTWKLITFVVKKKNANLIYSVLPLSYTSTKFSKFTDMPLKRKETNIS